MTTKKSIYISLQNAKIAKYELDKQRLKNWKSMEEKLLENFNKSVKRVKYLCGKANATNDSANSYLSRNRKQEHEPNGKPFAEVHK